MALASAQRDRVVASFTLLSAVGRLSPQVLCLRVLVYDANVHYQQVRDTRPACAHPTDAERYFLPAIAEQTWRHELWSVCVLAVCDTFRSSRASEVQCWAGHGESA